MRRNGLSAVQTLSTLSLSLALRCVHPAPAVPMCSSSSVRQRHPVLKAGPADGAPLAASEPGAVEPIDREDELVADASASSPMGMNLGGKAIAAVGLAAAFGLMTMLTALLAPMSSPTASGVKLVYAGAIAGIISRTCCAPLEMVSTVMMCRGDECQSMWAELRRTWKTEGLAGLFKGNGANCLKVAPSRGTQFLVYEMVKRQLAANAIPLSAGARLFAGGVAGMVAATIVYPIEVIKTMLTVFPEECKETPGGALGCALRNGIGGLYRGLGPTLVAMFPYVGVEFMVYETLKRRYEALIGATAGVAALLLGAIGGAAAQASAHPLDVVRRRMQLQGMGKSKSANGKGAPAYPNMFAGLYTIAKDEGAHVLFRGLGPACFEKVPSTAIGYYIYEGMKASLGVVSV